MPNPSHPRRINIRLGIKMRKNMERTKRRTRRVNRWRKGSEYMYDVENLSTEAAIRKIVEAKIRAD